MHTEITIEWAIEGFRYEIESTLKPLTVRYYCGELGRFSSWTHSSGVPRDVRLITKQHIQAFFHYLLTARVAGTSGRQPQGIEHYRWPYYRALRRFFSWATKEGYVERSPMDGIVLKAPKDPPVEPYHSRHIALMLAVLDREWQTATTTRQRMLAARDRAIFILFLESGLRLSEMAMLKTEDVDLEHQRALVREGKTGKGRLVGFGLQTKKALWRYMGLRPSDTQTDTLWLTEEYRPMTKYGVQEVIRRLKDEAGLQNVKGSVHKLRHTFATTYLRHTKDMKGCRILLGHSTLAMTERYTQFIDAEDALKAYDGEGPLDWLTA